jgi:predicted RNA-binding protein YlqC (UPF0109 family)
MTNPEIFDLKTDVESSVSGMLMQLIVRLVENPDNVSVRTLHTGEDVHFVVRVAPSDLERFRGSQGRTAKSLEVIVKALGRKTSRSISLIFGD